MAAGGTPESPDTGLLRGLFHFENGVSGIILLLIAVLPALEIVARRRRDRRARSARAAGRRSPARAA